jgi:hypothetical protein
LHKAIALRQPEGEPEIEEVYQILRLLGERQLHPLAPFVGAWSPTLVDLVESNEIDGVVRSLVESLRRIRKSKDPNYALPGADEGDFERLNEMLQMLFRTGSEPRGVFSECADFLIKEVNRTAWVRHGTKVAYLQDLVRYSEKVPLWIGTLNYDNALELAASHLGVDIEIGVTSGSMAVRFEGNARITLAKLHGSANWSFDPNGEGIRLWDAPVESRHAMIFGAGNKLRIEGPYLDLLFSFRSQLEKSTALQICGYSFRDQHVNHLLISWLSAKGDRVVDVYDPILTAGDCAANIARTLPEGWQLSGNGLSSRFRVHSMPASKWIETTFGSKG